MQHPPPMTQHEIDALTPYLTVFRRPGFVALLPPGQATYMRMYPAEVQQFRNRFFDICRCVHPYELLPEDPPWVEEGTGITKFAFNIDAVKTASANQIRRMLMLCTRGEHFGFLTTGDLVANGVIPAALERLLALRDEAPVGEPLPERGWFDAF
ncbi:MAG: hypothetical protein RLZZ297_2087 [Chloroflexota bacterium]